MFIVLITDGDGILDELVHIGIDRKVAVDHFLDTCKTVITNWDDYDEADVSELLDNGYELCGRGCILLIDTSNCKTDDEIRDELTKQPAGDMTVAEIVQDGELALKEGMTVDEILELCGNNLDACESHEIQGQILFKGSDGKWYTITTESIIGEATTQFVQDTLVEIDQNGN